MASQGKYQCPARRRRDREQKTSEVFPPKQREQQKERRTNYDRNNDYKRKRTQNVENHCCGFLQGDVWVWGDICSCLSLANEILPKNLPDRIRRSRKRMKDGEAEPLKIKSSQKGYRPPHRRNKTSEGSQPSEPASDAGARKSSIDGTQSASSSRSIGSQIPNDPNTSAGKTDDPPIERERPINQKTGEVIVRSQENAIMPSYLDSNQWKEPHEWTYLCEYYTKHDSVFAELQENKETGRDNKYVKTFFAFKDKNKDSSRTHRENIPSLFRRFYRYAVDIDLGTNFVQNFVEMKGTLFLEFGFAPGGMSKLLLDRDDAFSGVGVTLPPGMGGNVYPDDFLHHPQYNAVEADVINLANSGLENIEATLGTKMMDLSIIGITIHQPFDEFDHLDHQLIYSQLYFSLLYLKDGGSLLIRHKIGLSLIHTHLMILFLELFDGEPVFHKPLTEFAIRKTYWVLWKGFNREKLKEGQTLEKCLHLLSEVLKGNRSGYDYNGGETKEYYNACLITRSIEEVVEVHGQALLDLQHPMWVIQSQALKAYMNGKKDRPCRRGRCSGECSAAHCIDDLIPGIHENIVKVNNRIMEEQARISERIQYHEEEQEALEAAQPKSRWGRSRLNIKRKSHPDSFFGKEEPQQGERSQDVRNRFASKKKGAGVSSENRKDATQRSTRLSSHKLSHEQTRI